MIGAEKRNSRFVDVLHTSVTGEKVVKSHPNEVAPRSYGAWKQINGLYIVQLLRSLLLGIIFPVKK